MDGLTLIYNDLDKHGQVIYGAEKKGVKLNSTKGTYQEITRMQIEANHTYLIFGIVFYSNIIADQYVIPTNSVSCNLFVEPEENAEILVNYSGREPVTSGGSSIAIGVMRTNIAGYIVVKSYIYDYCIDSGIQVDSSITAIVLD